MKMQALVGVEVLQVLPFLSSLDPYYPGFQNWVVNTVVPGYDGGTVIAAREGNSVVGIAMGKAGTSPKLRCVRVHPSLQGSGVGLRLIDAVLDTIGCTKPQCTVAEELLHQYSRAFVRRYSFELSDVVKGMYRHSKLEYCFNGATT